MVANERVSLDESDIRAVREVTGVLDKGCHSARNQIMRDYNGSKYTRRSTLE